MNPRTMHTLSLVLRAVRRRALLGTLVLAHASCAPTCDEPAETSPSEAQDDPEPCSLSCTEDRDCNSDRPNCCDHVCRGEPSDVSEAP